MDVVVFKTYTYVQLLKIMRLRTFGLFAENAEKWIAQRVEKAAGDARIALRLANHALDGAVEQYMVRYASLEGPTKCIVNIGHVNKTFRELGWAENAEREKIKALTLEGKYLLIAMVLSDFTAGTFMPMRSMLEVHFRGKHMSAEAAASRTTTLVIRKLVDSIRDMGLLAGGHGSVFDRTLRADDVVYRRSFSSEDLWQVLNEESQHTHDAGLVRVVIDQKRVAKEQEQRHTLAANDSKVAKDCKDKQLAFEKKNSLRKTPASNF